MKELPTAEEFCKSYTRLRSAMAINDLTECLIEFAKVHVEAALKQAAHELECGNKSKFPGDENWVVDIESILNSYPLEKIK